MKPLLFLLLIIPSISFSQDSTGFDPDVRDVPLDTVAKKENTQTAFIVHGMLVNDLPRANRSYKYERPKLKQYLPSAAFVFAGGIFKELREASMFYRIKDGGFFDGRNSWKRKYKDGDYKQGEAFPLSTSLLVGVTDNVHFSQLMYGQMDAWSAVMMPYDPNRKFGHLLALVGARTGVEAIARFAVYSVFKNGNRQPQPTSYETR